jgi:uncharacterized protein (TIGR03382 family)
VLFQATPGGSCPINVSGVNPGTQADPFDPAGGSHGARRGEEGSLTAFPGGLVLPGVPTVLTPADGSTLTHRRPSLSGTAAANTTVILYLDGVEIGRVPSDASGNFSLVPTVDLSEGSHVVEAASELEGLRSTRSPGNRFRVDVTPPPAPVVSAPADGALVAIRRPAITGTAEPNVAVTVTLDGGVVGTVTADGAGNWSLTPDSPLADGPHAVKAIATDDVGNASPESNTRNVTVDATAPETLIASGPSGSTAERSATFDFDATEPDVTFECSLDGGAFAPCAELATFADLAEGSHLLEVRSRDVAGNVDATPATRAWTVDTPLVLEPTDRAFLGSGLGCAAGGAGPSGVLFGLGALAALLRRKRRRASPPPSR